MSKVTNTIHNKSGISVIGGLGLDTNVYIQKMNLDLSKETHFQKIEDNIGGTAGYSTRSYAKLGYNVELIGFIDDDPSTKLMMEKIKNEGISIRGVYKNKEGTKRSVNLVYPDGTRTTFYDGKASMSITSSDLNMDEISMIFKTTKIAHFSIVNWTRYLLPLAKKCNNIIVVDLQDTDNAEDEYRRDFIEAADYIFFSSSFRRNPHNLISEISLLNPHATIIATRGANGSSVKAADSNQIKDFKAYQTDLKIIDTNGAGDCFATGFVTSYLLEKRGLKGSIARANINALYVCTQKGDSTNFLNSKDLDELSNKQDKNKITFDN